LADCFRLANDSLDAHDDVVFKWDLGGVNHEDIKGFEHLLDLNLVRLVLIPVHNRPNYVPALANEHIMLGLSGVLSHGLVLRHDTVDYGAKDLQDVWAESDSVEFYKFHHEFEKGRIVYVWGHLADSLDYLGQQDFQTRSKVCVTHHRDESVDWLQSDHLFGRSLLKSNWLKQEANHFGKGIFMLHEQHISVVTQQQTEATT
jgi:hypothetical protein